MTALTPDDALALAEDWLVAEVPGRVASLPIAGPVYCLRVWYNDDSSESASLLVCPDAHRRRALAAKGDSAPHFLWCADELTGDSASAYTIRLRDARLAELMAQWFDRPTTGDEAVDLAPLRAMVQRAAARLGALDWARHIPATDDFVVFAADGTHVFCDDYGELTASVPPERVELLRSRGFLGAAQWYRLSDA